MEVSRFGTMGDLIKSYRQKKYGSCSLQPRLLILLAVYAFQKHSSGKRSTSLRRLQCT